MEPFFITRSMIRLRQRLKAVKSVGLARFRRKSSFQVAMEGMPLLRAEKTYNTSHPGYDATAVRNYPGRIFNAEKACHNRVYAELRTLGWRNVVGDGAWRSVLGDMLAEAKAVPHAEQVFERQAFIERYTAGLGRTYRAHYQPGWVNLEDALFLYWLVRRLDPRTIVQTGVCNGLSSAFMMLALVRNGPHGRLLAVDLPPLFNPNDQAWTARGTVYGVVIPEGKSSGWMVPDAYRERFEVIIGDAKVMLPKLLDGLDTIDMFYHDSDHTYAHMMFEFREAIRKLRPGGLIVGDDVSWNASVWDFADEHAVPSYNFKGTVGVAFF
jgi:predicted O-methyltransferase YrrM